MNIIAGAASLDNLYKSIINPICLDDINKYFHDNVLNKIKILFPDNKIFLWALSNVKNYKNKFMNINNGDILLLKENGQKNKIFFNYYGEVVYKIEVDNNIGNIIWKNYKWTRLIFVKNIKKINIEYRIVSKYIGYKENFDYPFTAVRELKDIRLLDIIKFNNTIKNNEYKDFKLNDIIDNKNIVIDDKLNNIINNINLLSNYDNHSERDHEALVKDFLEYCGYTFTKDFNYRIGFIDIGIVKNNKCVCVIDVKKEWDESKLIQQAQKQAFNYALENGSRYVI